MVLACAYHFRSLSAQMRSVRSLLERGGTSPAIDKLEELCGTPGIHPVSLFAACYMRKENTGDKSDPWS